MMYSVVLKDEYEKIAKMGKGLKISCYSAKQFEKLQKHHQVKVVGEVIRNNRKDEIARLQIKDEEFRVSEPGGHKRLFYRVDGYLCIGGDEYVALLKSRLPFFLLLLFLLLAVLLGVGLLSYYTSRVPVISPYNPLPLEDEKAEEIPDDTGTPTAQDGGGSVSLVYSLDADLRLSTGEIGIYFQNPGTSNHDVVLQLYIVSDGQETLIAESGRITAGKGLYQLSMKEGSASLSEGLYEGMFKVIFYDPNTGEKALVESDITDLTLTVTD